MSGRLVPLSSRCVDCSREIAVLVHPRELDDVAQLILAPATARPGVAQRRRQLRGFVAQHLRVAPRIRSATPESELSCSATRWYAPSRLLSSSLILIQMQAAAPPRAAALRRSALCARRDRRRRPFSALRSVPPRAPAAAGCHVPSARPRSSRTRPPFRCATLPVCAASRVRLSSRTRFRSPATAKVRSNSICRSAGVFASARAFSIACSSASFSRRAAATSPDER